MKTNRFTSILNYLGLTIAFAAFLVIMIQVDYEASFCSTYKDVERTYRVERGYSADENSPEIFMCFFSRPMIEKIKDAPEIERYSRIMGTSTELITVKDTEEKRFPDTKITGFMYCNSATLDMMNIELVCGSYADFDSVPGLLISERIAKRMYGNESPLERKLAYTTWYSGDPLPIKGVYKDLPKNSMLCADMAVQYSDFDLDQHNNQSTTFTVTLHEGVTMEEACQSMQKLADEYAVSQGYEEGRIHIRLTPIKDIHFIDDVKYDIVEKANISTLITLITVAIIILLVAMVNFWNISFASIPARIKSINTRKVLGASRESLIMQQTFETALLALGAFASAVILLFAIRNTTIGELISVDLNPILHIGLIGWIAIGVVCMCALAGLSPAFYSTSFAPALVLKGSFSHNVKGRQLRYILIGFQFIVSLALGIFALFVNIQTDFMLTYDKGFNCSNILYTELDYSLASCHKEFAENLKKHPEITDVTFTSREFVPMDGLIMGWGRSYEGEAINFNVQPVERNFTEFFDMKIIEGRHFGEQDENTSNAHIIFNAKAKEVYPQIDVDDTFFAYTGTDDNVVGICEDFHLKPLQFAVEPTALMYLDNNTNESMRYCYIKTVPGITTTDIEPILKAETIKLCSNVSPELIEVSYYDETVGHLYDKERRMSQLNFMSCILSVVIAIIGILGLITFETQYRRKEIAVRRVLGASIYELLSMFNGSYVKIVLICFVIAAPIAYFSIVNWVTEYTYQAPIPTWIFIVPLVTLIVIVVSTITASSLRAINVDPVKSIKTE